LWSAALAGAAFSLSGFRRAADGCIADHAASSLEAIQAFTAASDQAIRLVETCTGFGNSPLRTNLQSVTRDRLVRSITTLGESSRPVAFSTAIDLCSSRNPQKQAERTMQAAEGVVRFLLLAIF
jgi:hypothetical protein